MINSDHRLRKSCLREQAPFEEDLEEGMLVGEEWHRRQRDQQKKVILQEKNKKPKGIYTLGLA